MNAPSLPVEWRSQLRFAALGLVLAVLTLLYGQFIGITFGANEEGFKESLKDRASAVRETVYRGDEAAMKGVLDKSWTYMKRAHLHAGGMGTTAVALILLLSVLGTAPWTMRLVSLGLGGGGLAYSIYWMWAGFRAPALGSTGAAKESLDWLAIPASSAFVLATLAVLVLLVAGCCRRNTAPAGTASS
jgi:hypothetical protein